MSPRLAIPAVIEKKTSGTTTIIRRFRNICPIIAVPDANSGKKPPVKAPRNIDAAIAGSIHFFGSEVSVIRENPVQYNSGSAAKYNRSAVQHIICNPVGSEN
jgi:hypothetical protein